MKQVLALIIISVLGLIPKSGWSQDLPCVQRLDAIQRISEKFLNVGTDDALAEFMAKGTRNNACLIASLKDTRLRKNPFESPIISRVARSEVALQVLALSNGFSEEACFPDSLVEARQQGFAKYHSWFLDSSNTAKLAKRCSMIVERRRYIVKDGSLSNLTFPKSSCISALLRTQHVNELKKYGRNLSALERRCLIRALSSTELVNTPTLAASTPIISVGFLALISLSASPMSERVEICTSSGISRGVLTRATQIRMTDNAYRVSLIKCLNKNL